MNCVRNWVIVILIIQSCIHMCMYIRTWLYTYYVAEMHAISFDTGIMYVSFVLCMCVCACALTEYREHSSSSCTSGMSIEDSLQRMSVTSMTSEN